VLQSELIELSRLFKLTDFKIESQQNTFFRWSIEPSIIYFDAQLFIYTVQQADLSSKKSKVDIVIRRAAILTAFGLTADKVEVFTITRTLARNLHKLSQPRDSAYDDEQAIEDSYKKALQQDNHFSALALKSLLCRKNGRIEFGAVYQVN
jgi:Arc/MetJ family transcription regulator